MALVLRRATTALLAAAILMLARAALALKAWMHGAAQSAPAEGACQLRGQRQLPAGGGAARRRSPPLDDPRHQQPRSRPPAGDHPQAARQARHAAASARSAATPAYSAIRDAKPQAVCPSFACRHLLPVLTGRSSMSLVISPICNIAGLKPAQVTANFSPFLRGEVAGRRMRCSADAADGRPTA